MATNSKINKLLAGIFTELKPKTKLKLLEWVKKYGVLSAENSAVTGKFKPFPYQEGIFEAIGDEDNSEIWFLKSTRVGYTKIINFTIAYHIAEDPCPQLIWHPTDSKATEWSKKEMKPLIRDITEVRDKIYTTREDNNINFKSYAGGFIESRGAKTANNFASVTLKIGYADELDRFIVDVAGEGNPTSLMAKRLESYPDSLLIGGSTPTIKNYSLIEEKYNNSDKRMRFVPCPFCGHMQTIDFKNLVWDTEERDGVVHHLTYTTKLRCVSCNKLINEKQKKDMDFKGTWRQTKEFYCCNEWQVPEVWDINSHTSYAKCKHCGTTAEYNRNGRRKVGFFIWAGYSYQPNTTWKHIADAFIEAKGDKEKMKVFKNTWLAETWEDEFEKINTNDLKEKSLDYNSAPEETKIILMTVDTQNDRLEYLITAWCAGETSYNLQAGKIEGDPINSFVWDELERIFKTKIKIDNKPPANIFKCFIDMGGQRTDEVKKACGTRRDFIMLKGDSKEYKNNDAKQIGGLVRTGKGDIILSVATNKAKAIIFERLKLAPNETGSINHNHTFSDEWFEQITSERTRFKKTKDGYLVQTWEKTRERNEALDLIVYQLSAIKMIQQEMKLNLSL